MALQGLPVQDGVGLVLVKGNAPPLKGLLDPLPPAQLVPLVSNNGFFIKYLVIRLHHLPFDKPVTAGAPSGGPGGEGGVILVVLPENQGVGIQGVSSGVEEQGILALRQFFSFARLAQVNDRHAAAAPGANPGRFMLEVVQQRPVLRGLGAGQLGPGLPVPAAGGPQVNGHQPQGVHPAEKQVVREQVVHPHQILLGHGGPAVEDLPLLFGVVHPVRPLRRSQTGSATDRPGPALSPPAPVE